MENMVNGHALDPEFIFEKKYFQVAKIFTQRQIYLITVKILIMHNEFL
jgi:hypothetical protein